MNERTLSQLAAELAALHRKSLNISTVHNSETFNVDMVVSGIDAVNGKPFVFTFKLDKENCPELVEFFNSLGASLAAQSLSIQHKMCLMEQPA